MKRGQNREKAASRQRATTIDTPSQGSSGRLEILVRHVPLPSGQHKLGKDVLDECSCDTIVELIYIAIISKV